MVNVHKLMKYIRFLFENGCITEEERLEWVNCCEYAQDEVIKNILALPDSPAKAVVVKSLKGGRQYA